MKMLIIGLIALSSFSALADSAKLKVGTFKGELKIEGESIKVKSLTLKARLQHCNFFGTTCAGGPSEEKSVLLSFKEDSALNLVSITNSNSIKVSSFKPANRFSSCNLDIDLLGEKDGIQYEGYLKIIHVNNKEFCGSETEVAAEIANFFKTPQRVKVWKKY